MVVVNEFFFFLVFFYHPTVNQRTRGARAILRVVSSVVVCTFFRICSTCLSLREGVCFLPPDHFFCFSALDDLYWLQLFPLFFSSFIFFGEVFFSFFNALHNKEEGKFCFFFFYLARSFSFKYFSYVFVGAWKLDHYLSLVFSNSVISAVRRFEAVVFVVVVGGRMAVQYNTISFFLLTVTSPIFVNRNWFGFLCRPIVPSLLTQLFIWRFEKNADSSLGLWTDPMHKYSPR